MSLDSGIEPEIGAAGEVSSGKPSHEKLPQEKNAARKTAPGISAGASGAAP
jgi:hypothetical protein